MSILLPLEVYYHPSAKIEYSSPNINNKPWQEDNLGFETIKVTLNNKDENLQHLPDSIFYNLKNTYTLTIKKDSSIRSDRCLNFIKDSIYEGLNVSLFLYDPYSTEEVTSENAGRLEIISFGTEFEIANKHTPKSPVTKLNKPTFISRFFEYSMPHQDISEEQFNKTLLKF